jgi:3',5'-cyclic AMP phosphodiesterase CpdA
LRVAHLSDLHLLSLDGAVPFRLLNKRITGYANIMFRRGSIHKPFAVRAAARELRRLDIDHLVITGDVSNLALETEFDLVRRFLEDDVGLSPDRVSLVPGNHDVYTRGSLRTKRFTRFFEPFLTSDLPGIVVGDGLGAFPYVQLRGPLAFIGLSTAIPRLPLVASGFLGSPQLRALARIVEHPDVVGRMPVVLQHHPWHNPTDRAKRLLQGLGDAEAEASSLDSLSRGLLLHGHLHRRIRRKMPTKGGHLDAIGATSASLIDESDERMAGFNIYDFAGDGALESATSYRLVPAGETFREVPIPTD